MTYQQQLDNYINLFNGIQNPRNKILATFTLKEKPAMYHVPEMFIGRDSSPEAFEQHAKIRSQLALFAEIWMDGICVWREWWSSDSEKDEPDFVASEYLCHKILESIIFHGLSMNYQATKKRLEERGYL